MRFHSVLIMTILFWLTGCEPAPRAKPIELTGHAVGTSYTITLVDHHNQIPAQSLKISLQQLFREAKLSLSSYHQRSELNRINQASAQTLVPISDGLRTMVTEGIRLNQLTRGHLDISMAPLSALWGFGDNGIPQQIPSTERLAATLATTGLDKVQLTDAGLSKTHDQLQLDLDTLGKGYVVDRIAALLEQSGIDNYKVDVGGELRLKGRDVNNQAWHIEVIAPDHDNKRSQQCIYPRTNGMATSGDFQQYFERDGIRYSHILNPATGRPIRHKLAQVTVLHPSAMTADGLSTAIMVMGPDKGMAFAEANQLAVYMISRDGDGYTARRSSTFNQYLQPPT